MSTQEFPKIQFPTVFIAGHLSRKATHPLCIWAGSNSIRNVVKLRKVSSPCSAEHKYFLFMDILLQPPFSNAADTDI